MNFTGIGKITIAALAAFILLAIFVRGYEPSSIIIALLSVSTFLFGIFGAFIMQDRFARLNELRSILRADDSMHISVYKMSSVFGRDVQKKVQNLIDNYIVKTIDYRLEDYHMAEKEFLALYDYIVGLKPKNPRQTEVYASMLECVNKSNENRNSIGYRVRNRLEKYEWFSLVGLLTSIVFIVFYINDGSLSFIIISVLVSTASVMLLLLIRELDNLRWKEQKWIWEPLEDVFSDLDLLPYYPSEVLFERRVKPKKGAKIRIAYYPKPYPDFTKKEVIITSMDSKILPSRAYFQREKR